jgi:hypothetical protein
MRSTFGEISELMSRELSSRDFVLELVRWLDVRIATEPDGLERELLVRAFVATGPLLPATPSTAETLRAAEAFLAEPTDARYDALTNAATDSYPFGPGDGCFAIEALGHAACEPGSGCRSGAGCLASIAEAVDHDTTADAIRSALRGWLDSQPGRRDASR